VFERLRDALRAALEAATPTGDLRDLARQMREAVVDAKVAVGEMREALRRTEAELQAERQRLADADRRGRLAGEIQDEETVQVANRFAARHQERVAMLERKLSAQREELTLAERDLVDMQAQLKAAERDRATGVGSSSTEQAWRDLQAAGGTRPGVDLEDELLKTDMDRAARERAADEQLDLLKKKLGRKD
jgi:predicted  nucleic acid-binding Zn-ribbon protein